MSECRNELQKKKKEKKQWNIHGANCSRNKYYLIMGEIILGIPAHLKLAYLWGDRGLDRSC